MMKFNAEGIWALIIGYSRKSTKIIITVLELIFTAAALLEDLINYEEIQQPILMGLVGMLKAPEDSASGPSSTTTVPVPRPLIGKLCSYSLECAIIIIVYLK